jgi:MoxR-like ATPase
MNAAQSPQQHTVRDVTGWLSERIIGQQTLLQRLMMALLCGGHLLVEGAPGLAKTRAVKELANAVEGDFHRIQFTPDLLPSDITGVSIFNQERREFEFKPGAIFANIVVGDEINRASPKTQSALLECMEERQVTVDGVTYELAVPFMVVATQNPIEMEGTYPLPEAQRDRFMAQLSMGYPNEAAELAMLDTHGRTSPLEVMAAVSDATEIARLIDVVRSVHVSDQVRQYTIDLVVATRGSSELRLGASPRATLHLMRASRAAAALDDRDYVLPDDVQALASAVLAHRLLPTAEAQIGRRTTEDIVADIVAEVPVPDDSRSRRSTA